MDLGAEVLHSGTLAGRLDSADMNKLDTSIYVWTLARQLRYIYRFVP